MELWTWRPRRRVLGQVALLWEVRDLWVGCYWHFERRSRMWRLQVYLCAVPCLPVRLTWGWWP